MINVRPVTLTDSAVTLVPLEQAHATDLSAAAAEGELWKTWCTAVPHPDLVADEIKRRLDLQAKGNMLPFAVLTPDEKAVGMTTYMNIEAAHKRLEIGSTWYRKSVQRGPLNSQAKRLLLGHAFDDLGCNVVEFRTHFMNHQSRAAIERLGAKLDGVLRSHQITADGSLRDTCVYSILAHEWPSVRANLTWKLSTSK